MNRFLIVLALVALPVTASAASPTCRDLLFDSTGGRDPSYTCSMTAGDPFTTGPLTFSITFSVFAAQDRWSFSAILHGGTNPTIPTYQCQCKSLGSASKPRLGQSTAFVCLVDKNPGLISVLEGKVTSRGAKISKLEFLSPQNKYAGVGGSCSKL